MSILTKEAVEAYNQNHPEDDDLIYKDVRKQLTDELDRACEDLAEELIGVKQKWYERHNHYSEYLSIDDEIVDTKDFAAKVYDQVQVKAMENRFPEALENLWTITYHFANRADAERWFKKNAPNFNYKNKWNIGFCESNLEGEWNGY